MHSPLQQVRQKRDIFLSLRLSSQLAEGDIKNETEAKWLRYYSTIAAISNCLTANSNPLP